MAIHFRVVSRLVAFKIAPSENAPYDEHENNTDHIKTGARIGLESASSRRRRLRRRVSFRRQSCTGRSRRVRRRDALVWWILGCFHFRVLWHVLFSFKVLLHAFFSETHRSR